MIKYGKSQSDFYMNPALQHSSFLMKLLLIQPKLNILFIDISASVIS